MTTPNVDPHAMYKRLMILENRVDQLEADNMDLQRKIESMQAAAMRKSSDSEEHRIQRKQILDLFATLPNGFKMTVPTITENIDGMTSGQVASRVGTLVREGKLLKHQEDNKHPKFSLA